MGRVRNASKKILSLRTYFETSYQCIGLSSNGIKETQFVHRVVADTFLGNVKGIEVNHKDKNRSNNVLSNLEILSIQDHKAKDQGIDVVVLEKVDDSYILKEYYIYIYTQGLHV